MTGPLVSASWLAARLEDPGLVLGDCRWYLGEPDRGRRAFAAEHIPGAVYFDLERDLSASAGPGRHPLPDRDAFAETLSAKGVANDSIVVAYDDRGGAIAARLWWMLEWVGHRSVAVLDGGMTAWLAAQLPVTDAGGVIERRTFVTRSPLTKLVDRAAVAAAIGTRALVDARESSRYRGDEEPVDPVAGHIPTAINLPFAGNLAPDDVFLDPAALRARHAAAGPDPIVYCGSGVTACHDLLARRVAGLPDGALYPGSWSDWSTAGEAVATG